VNRLSKSWSARSDARPETSSTDPPGETSKAETSASTQRSGRLLRRLPGRLDRSTVQREGAGSSLTTDTTRRAVGHRLLALLTPKDGGTARRPWVPPLAAGPSRRERPHFQPNPDRSRPRPASSRPRSEPPGPGYGYRDRDPNGADPGRHDVDIGANDADRVANTPTAIGVTRTARRTSRPRFGELRPRSEQRGFRAWRPCGPAKQPDRCQPSHELEASPVSDQQLSASQERLNCRVCHAGLRLVRPRHPGEQVVVEQDHSPSPRV
jgi:hypothetical protein